MDAVQIAHDSCGVIKLVLFVGGGMWLCSWQ